MAEKQELKYFIRVANTDLKGEYGIERALSSVKGVNFALARAICTVLNLDGQKKAGSLDDATVAKLEAVVLDPINHGIPIWMVNRRKDYDTGEDVHLVTSELTITKEQDIKRERKIKSYVGQRHGRGLPVRGQRTKSNFRRNKGKGSLGVKRKGKK